MPEIFKIHEVSDTTSRHINSALDPRQRVSFSEELGLAPKADTTELPQSQENADLSTDSITSPGIPAAEPELPSLISPSPTLEHPRELPYGTTDNQPLLATAHHKRENHIDNNPSIVGLHMRGPQYSDISGIFTEAEYKEITNCYNIKGRNSWRSIAAKPIFRARSSQVRDLCQRLENSEIDGWLGHLGVSRNEMDQVLDKKSFRSLAAIVRQDLRAQKKVAASSTISEGEGTSAKNKHQNNMSILALKKFQKLLESNLNDSPESNSNRISEPKIVQKPSKMTNKFTAFKDSRGRRKKDEAASPYISDYEKVMLTFNQKSKKRRKSTSSSSSYGSTASFHSRSSFSSDASKFPYAYPSAIPQHQSFSDSDDYLRRHFPTTPTDPMETDYPPQFDAVDSPQPPLISYAPELLPFPSQSSVSLPKKPRGISSLFHLPRRHHKA